MIVLGIDTATTATAVGLRLADGGVAERRDDPPPGEHPGHATRLLAMVHELLRDAGTSWGELDRVAVGLGPGSFTGLRVGVATAHGLARSRGLQLVGVSSLRALALAALTSASSGDVGDRRARADERAEAVVAVIDARRGEVFAAAYDAGEDGRPRQLSAPAVLVPERLVELGEGVRGDGAGGRRSVSVLGDGAVRYAELLAGSGLAVAGADSSLHRVAAGAICELGAWEQPPAAGSVLPDYLRRPDAELALEVAAGASAPGTAA